MTGLRHTANTLEQAYQIFFEALKLDDIDAMVSAAWNYFNLPVLLTDENYKLIAQYPHRTIGEPIWDTLFTRKVLPRKVIERYQAEYLQGIERHYSPFYADSGLVAHCPRIFAEVYDGDQIFGHVAVFLFSEPLQDNDLPAMAVFVDALKMLMVPRKNRTHLSLSTYLKDLLEPDTAPPDPRHGPAGPGGQSARGLFCYGHSGRPHRLPNLLRQHDRIPALCALPFYRLRRVQGRHCHALRHDERGRGGLYP